MKRAHLRTSCKDLSVCHFIFSVLSNARDGWEECRRQLEAYEREIMGQISKVQAKIDDFERLLQQREQPGMLEKKYNFGDTRTSAVDHSDRIEVFPNSDFSS